MLAADRQEFRWMLAASGVVHAALLGAVLWQTSGAAARLTLPNSGAPMNVMWARTLQAPPKTPEWKLPGPVVPPAAAKAEAKPEAPKPKVVLEKPKEKLTKAQKRELERAKKEAAEEEARRKAMEDALASVRKDLDTRPTPRPENFPSEGPAGAVKGAPGSPFGGLGGGTGTPNPARDRYILQVEAIVNDKLVWLRKEPIRAEAAFRVDREGNVLDPVVTAGSGDAAFDNAALRAIRRSSPLPPPPPEVAEEALEEGIVMTFDPNRRRR